jgi:hypothetical protein
MGRFGIISGRLVCILSFFILTANISCFKLSEGRLDYSFGRPIRQKIRGFPA